MKKRPFLIMLLSLLVFACSSSDDGSHVSGPSGSIVAVTIPDTGSGGFGIDLKTTNAGLYFRVYKPNEDAVWVYRLPSAGPSSNWMRYDFPDIQTWHPYNDTNEGTDTFGIFYSSVTQHGFFSINTNSPDPTMDDNPLSMFSASNASSFLVDNSEGGYTWLFDGNVVLTKQNNSSDQYDIVATLPESISIENVVASPDDAVVWIGGDEKCFRVTINGDVTTYDVSGFMEGGNFVNFVDKIRFSEDEVFFKCYNKVFKVNGSSVALFYEIKSITGFTGGDFAVDNSYMYATDGFKKDIDLGTEIRFVPEPNFTDFETAMNFTAFTSGQIEASKNPTDNYVYVLYTDKILFVTK